MSDSGSANYAEVGVQTDNCTNNQNPQDAAFPAKLTQRARGAHYIKGVGE